MLDDPEEGLAAVRRQHEAMAARIHLPLWYRALFAATWAGVLAGPLLARDHDRFGLPAFPYWMVTTALLLVLLLDYRRRSGLHTLVRSRTYPALREQVVPTSAVVLGSVVVVWGLTLLGLPYMAGSCALLAGGLASRQVWQVNRAIRLDVVEGR
ncbi:hypothetical protein [Actinosynnema sp. NPDC023587]|uniref:hypothetical protein n=1 Tax=Actinosynnema sp. NPDC023587 TaxID=3154695 RepID=UPI003409761E